MAVQPPFTPGLFQGFLPWRTYQDKTTNYGVLLADNGTQFSNSGAAGAVTFTLPALAPNYRFAFHVAADQNLVVQTAAADNGKLIAPGNALASSVAFQTPGLRVGGYVVLYTGAGGTAWAALWHGAGALTVS